MNTSARATSHNLDPNREGVVLRVPESAIDLWRALVGTVVVLAVVASIPVLVMPFLTATDPAAAIEFGLAIGGLAALVAAPFVFRLHWRTERRSRAARRASTAVPRGRKGSVKAG